jgi:hypothetical protein
MNSEKIYTITKKIAKHGKQSVIVIPKFLTDEIKLKSIVEVSIKIIRGPEIE